MTKTTASPEPTEEVLEDFRGMLSEALRTLANIAAHTSIHLEETGDVEAAQGEMGVAMLAAWLSDNVRAWTHTTRLREGLVKFDPLAAGAALGTPVAIVLVAVAFGGFQLGSVLVDARLQDSITGPGRATVTSLAGVGTEVTTLTVFGLYAVFGSAAGHGAAFALLALPYLVAAAALSWVGRRRQ